MFDLTQSTEFMAALEKAVVVAVANAQIITPGVDPENDWMTPREAMAFLRLGETAFKGFRERNKLDLVTTTGVNTTEVRYQRASLQKIMRKSAVGLPAPAPAPARPSNGNGNGRHPRPAPDPARDRQLTGTLL